MKTSIICITGALLLGPVLAQPYAFQGAHGGHGPKHKHDKRQAVDVVTDVEIVTMTAPEVIVIVDDNGNPIATSTQGLAAPPTVAPPAPPPVSSPSPVTNAVATAASLPSSAPAPPPPASSAASAAPTSANPAPPPPPPSSNVAPAPSPSSSGSSNSGIPAASSLTNGIGGYGIAYDPYTADSQCKDQGTINSDVAGMAGYSLVRIYGTDCNQTAAVLAAAKPLGMQLMAGVSDITQVQTEVQAIIDAAQGDWSAIHTVAVGNELVNSGTASVGQVLSALGSARAQLQAAGYPGHVVTVDTFIALENNPSLCQQSDYAAANAHAFFDADTQAPDAGTWLLNTAQAVQKACGKSVTITESGWPTSGQANGAAVPGKEQQSQALSSIKNTFTGNVVLFSAYNDLWKQNTAATFGAEQAWGILD